MIASTRDARLALTARALAIDAQTAIVVRALRRADVEPILLKGPSFVRWLYNDGVARGYVDSDLLVSETAAKAATQVLKELGFSRVPTAVGVETAATTWEKQGTPGQIDLHTSLWLFRPPRDLWALLMRHTQQFAVAGLPVTVLDDTAKTVHVVTHAVQGSFTNAKANTDLLRAISQVSTSTWAAALALADEVGAGEAFRAGLLAVRESAELCAAIGLTFTTPPRRLQFLLDGRGDGEEMLLHLYRTTGFRNKISMLRAKVFPPLPYLRRRYEVGAARQGNAGYLYARYWRSLLYRSPRGVRNVFRRNGSNQHRITLRPGV